MRCLRHYYNRQYARFVATLKLFYSQHHEAAAHLWLLDIMWTVYKCHVFTCLLTNLHMGCQLLHDLMSYLHVIQALLIWLISMAERNVGWLPDPLPTVSLLPANPIGLTPKWQESNVTRTCRTARTCWYWCSWRDCVCVVAAGTGDVLSTMMNESSDETCSCRHERTRSSDHSKCMN